MKKFLLVSCAMLSAAAVAGSANAQEANWSGPYIGVQGGGEWASVSGPFTASDGTDATPYSNNPSGGLLGLQAGYNWQSDALVFGIDADVNAAIGVKDSVTLPSPPTSYLVETRQRWTADIRAKVGYALDATMLYVAGGLALGDVRTYYGGPGYAPPGGTPFSVTTQRVGWTLGAGVAHAFGDHFVGNIEYRYSDLGSKSFSNADPLIDTADTVKFRSNAAVVGLAYRF